MSPLARALLARAEKIRDSFLTSRLAAKPLPPAAARAAEELSRRLVERLLEHPREMIDRAEREGVRSDSLLAAHLFHLYDERPEGGR